MGEEKRSLNNGDQSIYGNGVDKEVFQFILILKADMGAGDYEGSIYSPKKSYTASKILMEGHILAPAD
jgi:hypothetical protein